MANVTAGYNWVSGEVVTPAKMNSAAVPTISNIVDADVSSSAAIAHSKLANITAGQVLLGNASNVPTATALSGDVTVTSAGVTAIGSAKVLPAMLSQPYTLATAQNSTSGTSIDFTGIPSWAKRITIMFRGVSTNGTSELRIRLGTASGFVTTGYISRYTQSSEAATTIASATNGFGIRTTATSSTVHGVAEVIAVGANAFIFTYNGSHSATLIGLGSGSIALADALTQLRITTDNGTDTFDAGEINIAYAG